MDSNTLGKYARLVIKTGINLQKQQMLVIVSPIECAPFARTIAEIAYREGAKDVVISWRDELFSKLRFMQAPEEVFSEFPKWQQEFFVAYAREGAAFVSISAADPELMKDVKPDRLAKAQKASSTALQEYRERLMSNKNTWCIVSIPTQAWANKVFPQDAGDVALDKLWESILAAVRVNAEDPIEEWKNHKANLSKNRDFLNSQKITMLHYKNSLGTDLTIQLPENHLWLSGSEYTPEGVEFIANMPTEEVFTLPHKTGVNGTVYSSKPLNYNGNIIDNFSVTFKDGKVVEYKAEKGYDILKKLLETDEGACYLGEVALVPFTSPISQANILFYNTLFDENASCHLAFGKAYPVCIQDGDKKSKEELAKQGVNDSLIHVDFMVGTADLEITGTTAQGKEFKIFTKGNFAF
jgi:aminopeptidase